MRLLKSQEGATFRPRIIEIQDTFATENSAPPIAKVRKGDVGDAFESILNYKKTAMQSNLPQFYSQFDFQRKFSPK
jgi:hypothetical protein